MPPSPKPASSTLTRVLLGAAAVLVVAGGGALWLAARLEIGRAHV